MPVQTSTYFVEYPNRSFHNLSLLNNNSTCFIIIIIYCTPTYPADSPDLRCFFIGTAIGKDLVIITPKEMHVSVNSDVSKNILLMDHLLQQHMAKTTSAIRIWQSLLKDNSTCTLHSYVRVISRLRMPLKPAAVRRACAFSTIQQRRHPALPPLSGGAPLTTLITSMRTDCPQVFVYINIDQTNSTVEYIAFRFRWLFNLCVK